MNLRARDGKRVKLKMTNFEYEVVVMESEGYVVHSGCDHIFFIGFLGAGKTTLAKNLGRMFHRVYVDTDRLAESICKKPIDEVYRTDGEDVFKNAETEALKRLKSKKSLLVSCGGAIVDRPENIALMKEMGSIVYLDGEFDDSVSQIIHFKARPEFGEHTQALELYSVLKPLYEEAADVTIDIHGKGFDEVASEAGALLWDKGLL